MERMITKADVQTKLPKDIHDIEVIEIDEMWHFTGKKHTTQIESPNANVRHYLARKIHSRRKTVTECKK